MKWIFVFSYKNKKKTYIVFDDKLGSDVFLRLLRFLFCDNLSLNDSERLTETGADFALTLEKQQQKNK